MLRLLETFSLPEVEPAPLDALQLDTISFDAVKHLRLSRVELRPPRLDLETDPHLLPAADQTPQDTDSMARLSA